MFLCCLAALAPTGAAQTPANVGCFNVHKELSIGITEETEMVRGVFDRFFNAYVVQMQQRANSEQQSDWEFWVVLRPDPKHRKRPHILIVGHSGGLTVRVADLNPTPGLKVQQESASAAQASIEVTLDPFFRELAGGKSTLARH